MNKKNLKLSDNKALNSANQLIIDQFNKLINLILIENTLVSDPKIFNINIFRIANLKKNLKVLSNYKNKIVSSKQLTDIKGFGSGTLDRIDEILNNGFLQEVQDLELKYKESSSQAQIINELMNVIGIGKNVANDLIQKFNITSLDDLVNRAKNHLIQVNDKIKLGLKYIGKYETIIPRDIVTQIYDLIESKNTNNNIVMIICGSYRRGLPQSSDIDILLFDFNVLFKEDIDKSDTLQNFILNLKHNNIITQNITSEEVSSKYMGFCKYKKKTYRIDIRFMPIESFITALVYFTGSYQLNTLMRSNAKKLGYKLNEYGLFNLANNKMELINSEEELFKFLKMKYLEPEQRNLI